ncbi:MAG TPA: hypothetical protein VFU55_06835 [Terracidiphilus sp.]|nr:hypothetical protein [Terracidiphilus sp.]
MSSSQPQPALTGTILGFPLKGFSFFQSMLLAVASAFFTFFASTALAIFSLLVWNQIGGHSVNYADTYLYVGFPLGVLVLLLAVPFFGVLWLRARVRR